jgi:uncharacterized protein with HEPN domain
MSEATDRAIGYIAKMSKSDFLNDEKTQDAILRALEVIGEASHSIMKYHDEFATSHPEIPWKAAYSMCTLISHPHQRVDLNHIWDTVHNELPILAGNLDRALASL